MKSVSKRVAFFCVLLTLFSAIAFVAHHHSSGTDSAKCTICATAHSSAPKTVVSLTFASWTAVAIVRVQAVSAKQRLIAFALCVRPPPAL
jgi:hypothetical protein